MLAIGMHRQLLRKTQREQMSPFDHETLQASPDWVSEELARKGYLRSGRVVGVTQKPGRFDKTSTSRFHELDLEYSSGSTGDLPTHCLMKVCRSGSYVLGRKELIFYEHICKGVESVGLLKSYGSALDHKSQSAVILLEDAGDHFRTTEWPIPPSIADCESAVTSLALLHAEWWNSSKLSDPEIVDPEANTAKMSPADPFSDFFALLGDELSTDRRRIIERTLDLGPKVYSRRKQSTESQTFLHGDSHFWNFLICKDGARFPFLIDWQSWTTGFGAMDLAYMIAVHWFPERRRRYEERLLCHYLSVLHSQGIDYSHDDLWYDYRLAVMVWVTRIAVFPSLGVHAYVWWPHLDRVFSAYEDLNCGALLD